MFSVSKHRLEGRTLLIQRKIRKGPVLAKLLQALSKWPKLARMDSTQEQKATAKMVLTYNPSGTSAKHFLTSGSESRQHHCASDSLSAHVQCSPKIPCNGTIPRAFSERLLGPLAARRGWTRFSASGACFALMPPKVATTIDLRTGLSQADRN